QLGSRLMDIHSQHETLALGEQSFQLRLIDTYAGNQELREQYAHAWSNFQAIKRKYEQLTAEAESLRQEADFIQFQLDELTRAGLQENEQEELEKELKVMEHAEEIKARLHAALQLLGESEFSATRSLAEIRSQLQA